MPRVSVVIPTYNRAHLIAESIQSVINQSYADFEIIIVDDGSTDNTKEVVDSFQEPRIRYVYQENQGVAVAGNHGFKLARGEYVAFFSSDDILLKNAIEKGVQVLDKYPEAAFSYGQIYVMDEKGRVFDTRNYKRRSGGVRQGTEEIRQFLLYDNVIPAMTVMARRSCLFEIGLYDTSFRYGSEDIDLFIRLARKYAVAHLAEPIAIARRHSGRLSTARKMDEEERTKTRLLEGIFDDPEFGHLFSSQKPKVYFHLHLRLARHAYVKGEMKAAREHLFKALKIHPRGFIKNLWLPWIYQFARTWIPLRILISVAMAKRCLNVVIGEKLY